MPKTRRHHLYDGEEGSCGQEILEVGINWKEKKVYEKLELVAYGNDDGCEVKGEEEFV